MSLSVALPKTRRLSLSPTLTAYIGRQFVTRFLSIFLTLCGVIMLVSVVDLLDRLANRPDVGLGTVLQMVLLKTPFLSQEIMPFTILFAGMATFWRLTRTNELVVARSAGVSVWQFLLPVVLGAAIIGGLSVMVLNPLASIPLSRYQQIESRVFSDGGSVLSVQRTGLWLRQADPEGQSVIHAQRVSSDTLTLHEVIVFRFGPEDRFLGRIDAPQAELQDGIWALRDAWQAEPGQQPTFSETLEVATELTPDKIQDSFAPPETVSFWSLPGFIKLLERAGFSGHRHRLHFHRLLALPLLFVSMILIAATFSLRPQRRGRIGLVILSGVGAGFLLHLISNFVFALGLSGRLPAELAGWTPAGISLMLGVTLLLHLEDG